MTKLSFYNGLKEIGGTYVEVETDKAKCMFDFGFAVSDRSDEKIAKRADQYIEDYLRLGMLTPADGIYENKVAAAVGKKAYGETGKECFFIISHMHIDHMGGLGMLHPDVPVYMSSDSLKLYRKLEETGDVEYRGHQNCIGVDYDESFTVGDITVKVIRIDHDVIGACGYLISTPDGSICYTGDYRFHGYHPEYNEKFASEVKGCNVLITEGVTVSSVDVDMLTLTEPEIPGRTEYTLLEDMKTLSSEDSGILVINPYNRNIERMHNMINVLSECGRTLVLDYRQAELVSAFYPDDGFVVSEVSAKRVLDTYDVRKAADKIPEGWRVVTRKEMLEAPEKYVLQLDYTDMYELFDIKQAVTRYLHMDGAPLGAYDPSYDKMKKLLEVLGIPYEYRGTGGHARPYYLKHMIDMIEPKVLIPLHSFRPEQVQSEKAGMRILPEYGDSYTLCDGELKKI